MSLIQLGLSKVIEAPSVRVARKLRVYTNEFNIVCGAYRYLPFSTGLLRAYAETDPTIRANYQFMPFLYEMDKVDRVLAKYTEPPDVAAFSVSMWNERLNLAVASEVKKRYPKCLIIFGGCHVPHHPREYMTQHSFIDVCVRSEGEEAFRDILVIYPSGLNFSGVPDVTYKEGGEILENLGHREFNKNLDAYPSPYLTGLYDQLMSQQTEQHQYQSIIESNRGCNWNCDFCYWGAGGMMTRYRFHSMEYVKDEITWMGKHHVNYVFGADSNWGQHPRDMELTQHIVETKNQWGYPSKFRVCYGKNSDEKIFAIGALLHEHGLEKGITLARQSNDEVTLANIHRANIKLETYRNLQSKFNEKEVPVYSELILGLPGETVVSWKKGIDELLTAGLKNQLFCYILQVLPNTGVDDLDYREKHGIKTRLVELTEIHGSRRDPGWITEYEELVIATNTMPYRDWREMGKFSWMTMLLHSMKSGFFVLSWLWDRYKIEPSEFIDRCASFAVIGNSPGVIQAELRRWDDLLDRISVFGESRGQILEGYGDIYWDVEEAALLRMAEGWEKFYQDLQNIVVGMLQENDIEVDWSELDSIFRYQRMRMPSILWKEEMTTLFPYNVPEYFDKLFSSSPVPLEKKSQELTTKPKDWGGDKEKFARECILWGRKSGTMLVPCEWKDA